MGSTGREAAVKNILTLAVCLLSMFLLPNNAYADGMRDLKESVQAVREKLVVLLVTTDKDKQAKRIEGIEQLSQDIDVKLKALLEDKKTPENTKKNLAEFQSIWTAFRTTRDMEIIPNLLSGDSAKISDAKKIARTIQAERFQKMQILLQ